MLENPEQSTEILEWLRGAGAEIVLDEFGTGCSSFSYLEKLPFAAIKIDQAFVQAGNVKGGNDSVLVRSMVALARELGKKVVAGPGERCGSRLRAFDRMRARPGALLRQRHRGDRGRAGAGSGPVEREQAQPVGVFRPTGEEAQKPGAGGKEAG